MRTRSAASRGDSAGPGPLESFSVTTFTELGLAAPLLKALEAEGYTQPTPIQAQAIPAVLTGSDMLGIAQTGTGKTAAFALPILHRLAADRKPAPRKGCRALVLSPTRELASQIADSFRVYGRHMQLSVTTVFGGVGHRPQIRALSSGVDILIATPGRLLDHIGERVANLQGTEILVLDEADQMLDMGFVKPIRQIVSGLSMRRQTLFFSATMPGEIRKLAGEFLRDPVTVAVTPVSATADRIDQRVIHVEARKKRALLAELLADEAMSRTLVFTRTKRGADRVAKHLTAAGIEVAAIHGNKSQRQREDALDAFRRAKISVLVATDIAARGIDVDQVSHVINFELPEVPEAYVHRIGRTARAGASGSAISLCDNAERDLLRAIERLTRQTIPSEDRRHDNALAEDAAGTSTPDRARNGARGGNRSTSRGGGGRNRAEAGNGNDRRRTNAPGARNGETIRTPVNAEAAQRPARSQWNPAEPRSDAATGASRANGGDRAKTIADVGFMAAPRSQRSSEPKREGEGHRTGGRRSEASGQQRPKRKDAARSDAGRPAGDRNTRRKPRQRTARPETVA